MLRIPLDGAAVLLGVSLFLGQSAEGAEPLEATTRVPDALSIAYERVAILSNELANAETVAEKCRLIIFALKEELRHPMPGVRPNSYLTNDEYLQLQYLEMLSDLGGNASTFVAAAKLGPADDYLAALLTIARGLAGDSGVHLALVPIIEGGNSPFLRMMAVRALGQLKKPEAVPLLKRLLDDAYYREASDSLGPYRIYVVREEAARALKEQGVKTVRRQDKFILAD
jgi:hypothetical protein